MIALSPISTGAALYLVAMNFTNEVRVVSRSSPDIDGCKRIARHGMVCNVAHNCTVCLGRRGIRFDLGNVALLVSILEIGSTPRQ